MYSIIVKQILEQYIKNKNCSYFLRFAETVQMNHYFCNKQHGHMQMLLMDFVNLLCCFPTYCTVATNTVIATVIVATNTVKNFDACAWLYVLSG